MPAFDSEIDMVTRVRDLRILAANSRRGLVRLLGTRSAVFARQRGYFRAADDPFFATLGYGVEKSVGFLQIGDRDFGVPAKYAAYPRAHLDLPDKHLQAMLLRNLRRRDFRTEPLVKEHDQARAVCASFSRQAGSLSVTDTVTSRMRSVGESRNSSL